IESALFPGEKYQKIGNTGRARRKDDECLNKRDGKEDLMARKTRIWYPGAMYHVMCRGHRGQAIFLDNEDRRVFLNRLLHAIRDHSCNILSYCLMTNHVHLQVETSQV
ncbi:MAG TPA: hypothetical protein DDW87_00410, partial [Firmicutes bacterium]|nr:hypothetical protein [Bacillota bacterium]